MQQRNEDKWDEFWKFFRYLAAGLAIPTVIITTILIITYMNNGEPVVEIVRLTIFCILLYLMLVTMGAVWRWRLNKSIEQAQSKKKRR